MIGGSAGALAVLHEVLPAIARTSPLVIVVVVHLRHDAAPPGPRMLAARAALPVRVPYDKQPCDAGVVWVAPADFHLLVERDRVFALSQDEPVHFSRPAIDVLFDSAADAFGDRLVAVVLSGASRDGADGARRVRACGGLVVVEDPATAAYSYMPTAAIECSDPQIVCASRELPALLAVITEGTRG